MPEEVIWEATQEEIKAAVRPETQSPESVTVGGKKIEILPMKRRWQVLFGQAALPMYKPELAATEAIEKSVKDGTADFTSFTDLILKAELEMDAAMDRVVAVILASQTPGSEKDTENVILSHIAWLQDNATTEEMRNVVEKQMAKERLIEIVGERLPARFARSLHLGGRTDVSIDIVKQALTSSWQKLEDTDKNGDGTLTSLKPGGTS